VNHNVLALLVGVLATACGSDDESRCGDWSGQTQSRDFCQASDNACLTVQESLRATLSATTLVGRVEGIECTEGLCAVAVAWPNYERAVEEYPNFLVATGCASSVTLPSSADACARVSATIQADCTRGGT
jgi:hypothetical protein